jgi:Putative zincin peptidase
MFLIPGPLIALATFPGVIVHELAHQLFCRWFRVPVLQVCYFRVGNPAGFVIHEPPTKSYQSIFISIGPFLINSILGALIAFPAALPVIKFGEGDLLDYLLIWLGISIAMHAIPSSGDAKSLWQSVKGPGLSSAVRFAVAPIVGIICLGAVGRFFWLDLIYGIGVAIGLPTLLVAICSALPL